MTHYEILRSGVGAWNKWRLDNLAVIPNLREADLYEANLRGADLREANLYEANLRGANLREADLRGANLIDANLCEPNLRGANLYEANLRGANLRGADLIDANLSGANLSGADLRGANLSGADIRGADLREADLGGADLGGADLREADLRGADLYKAGLACAIGNEREVRSLLCFERIVTYTATHIFVGCQTRSIDEWFSITDDELQKMSPNALERWRKWGPIIKQIIDAYPATKQVTP